MPGSDDELPDKLKLIADTYFGGSVEALLNRVETSKEFGRPNKRSEAKYRTRSNVRGWFSGEARPQQKSKDVLSKTLARLAREADKASRLPEDWIFRSSEDLQKMLLATLPLSAEACTVDTLVELGDRSRSQSLLQNIARKYAGTWCAYRLRSSGTEMLVSVVEIQKTLRGDGLIRVSMQHEQQGSIAGILIPSSQHLSLFFQHTDFLGDGNDAFEVMMVQRNPHADHTDDPLHKYVVGLLLTISQTTNQPLARRVILRRGAPDMSLALDANTYYATISRDHPDFEFFYPYLHDGSGFKSQGEPLMIDPDQTLRSLVKQQRSRH